jgi:hypothetical protein
MGASTLSKSMDLVLIELGTVFVPVLARAIAFLQDFAAELRDTSTVAGKAKAGLGGVAETFTSGKSFEDYLMGRGGVLGFFTGQVEKYAKERAGITPERDQSANEYIDAAERYRAAFGEGKAGGLGAKSKDYFGKFKDGQMADPSKFPKDVADELKKQGRLKDFEDFFGKKFKDLDPVKGGSGKPYLTDFPTGYQAKETGVADVRSQLQLQAFQKSPLDMEKERRQRENDLKVLEELRRIADNTGRGKGNGMPPRAN